MKSPVSLDGFAVNLWVEEIMTLCVLKPHFNIEVACHGEGGHFKAIASTLSDVAGYYPDFKEWLYFTFRRGVHAGTRRILVAHNEGRVAGLALLKNDSIEKKICTFYVVPEFRGYSLAHQLMERAVVDLGEKNILISVAEERRDELFPTLKHAGFSLNREALGCYREGKTEFYYSS